MAAELWRELGETMRRHRRLGERSLRALEAEGGWRRGTLSQVENGKARPSHALVSWYDRRFGGDGLLLSLYAEARAADTGPGPAAPDGFEQVARGDAMTVLGQAPPAGTRLAAGSGFEACWELANTGTVPWRNRGLRRIGPHAGLRVIGGPPWTAVPDTVPGGRAVVRVRLTAPDAPGSVIAYWRMVDEQERFCRPATELLTVVLAVRAAG